MDADAVLVDDAAVPLGCRRPERLADDLGKRGRRALDGAGQGIAAERPEADRAQLGLLARLAAAGDRRRRMISMPSRSDDRPLGGEIERHDRDVLLVDVEPDVELGPVGQREDAEALASPLARIVEPPRLGPLALRVPAMMGVAEREHPLLGPRCLLVAASSADGGIEAMAVERLAERLRLHHVGVDLGAVRHRADAALETVLVDMHDQVEPEFLDARRRGRRSCPGTSRSCRHAGAGTAAAQGRRPFRPR